VDFTDTFEDPKIHGIYSAIIGKIPTQTFSVN